jgi:hypothetical protein
MDAQFSDMHGNPDIVIATPGRLLHIMVEMELDLSVVEYVVFDECDRLFEMGFAEQQVDVSRFTFRLLQPCRPRPLFNHFVRPIYRLVLQFVD